MKITSLYEMSYIREMGNPRTHITENELILILPVGCYWAKKTGGCSYCGYQPLVDEMRKIEDATDYVSILQEELEKYNFPIHRISFFVGGSFFEIPNEIQVQLLQIVNEQPTIHSVYIESRAELINDNNIANCINTLTQKQLFVAIGLESSDTFIRNKIHKKGLSLQLFNSAVNIINNHHANSLVYVFVKPPKAGISDIEAKNEALASIDYCFNNGVDEIELECGYIVENSYIKELYDSNQYLPIKLNVIQDILLDAFNRHRNRTIRLAYFSDTPEPIEIPKNCDTCSPSYYEMFNLYRRTLDKKVLNKKIQCNCQNID